MSLKTDNVLAKMREEGLSIDEFMSELLLADASKAYIFIQKEVDRGKKVGLDADIVFDKLTTIIDEELIFVYMQVEKFINAIASDDSLKIEMFPESEIVIDDSLSVALDFAKVHKDFVKDILKDRGVNSVGVVYNAFSDVLTFYGNNDEITETSAWQDYFEDMYNYFKESLYYHLDNVFTYELKIEYDDIKCLLKEVFSYIDIYNVLKSNNTSDFTKHEYDIYFAYKAISGDCVYISDNINIEIQRLYEYLYSDFEEIFNYLEKWDNGCSYNDVDDFIDSWIMQQLENTGYCSLWGVDADIIPAYNLCFNSYYGIEYME